ncbi:MAG TPA: hypothetical protein VKT30_04680 [Caulobacteraceae bacterium]|nr:hypothetical protein [Caulobacteraceae bacterium]
MKKLMLAAAGAVGLASAAIAATPAAAQPLPLIKADYYCGPGWHLNYWDHCVPNRYGYYYGGPTFVFGFGPRVGFGFHERGFGFRGHFRHR